MNVNDEGAASSASSASSAAAIASLLVQEFNDRNATTALSSDGASAIASRSSAKILKTLLRNALSAESVEQYAKHGTVRLANAKIQKFVVNVPGALDILVAGGFAQHGEHLQFQGAGARDSAERGHQRALIEALCEGLDLTSAEFEASKPEASPAATAAPAAAAAASKIAASVATPTNTASSNDFLSDEERQCRIQKIKAAKRAQREERERAKARWNEDMEEKKAAAQRREALLQQRIREGVDADDFAVAQNVHIAAKQKSGGILPRPFEEEAVPRVTTGGGGGSGGVAGGGADPQALRRQMIQQCMKDDTMAAQEKQSQIQNLMKMSSNAILAAAASASSLDGRSDDAGAQKSSSAGYHKMETNCDNEEDRKQPPPASAEGTPPPRPDNSAASASVPTPAPPSSEWTQFLQHTPRCAGAEGIRDTSVLYRSSSATTIPKCLKRLFREFDGLKDDLPADPSCSIWLRFDEETPQYIRALITASLPGPTPYSGGMFTFDIYVPDDYPQSSPKVQLLTTGGGRVRFGPNLYADGKVCLSLLGTWEGPKWMPKKSSLYQVLVSIQALIFGEEHPYYLEPGHGGWEGKVKRGDFQVTGHTLAGQSVKQEMGVPHQVVAYEDALRVGTARYAMIEPLKWSLDDRSRGMGNTGLEAFGDIVKAHFFENRNAILREVRSWMQDGALGRDRSKVHLPMAGGKKSALQIDALKTLLPKLEDLLGKVSMPQCNTESSSEEHESVARGTAISSMEVEDLKPPARAKMQLTEAKAEENASELDVVEKKRQEMKEAAENGDYIAAGKLQEEVKRLEELQQGMKKAAQQGDFIRAGRLQAQFKSLTDDSAASAKPGAKSNYAHPMPMLDEEYSDSDNLSSENNDADSNSEGMDWEDEEDTGPPFAPPFHGHPHGLGSNAFAPPKYKSNMISMNHSWGTGHTLAAPPAPASPCTTSASQALDEVKKSAPQKVIPPDQLCRLRIRLPLDKSVVEDFHKDDPLEIVYRRLEPMFPDDDMKQTTAKGSLVPGGAFAQPLSSAGFTLLLARPKREFSLEMHGTRSLQELNLTPSATLTLMKCTDRGIVYRGEVESRLRSAQGDAMDVEGLTYEGLMEITERVGKAEGKGDAFLTLTKEEFEANTQQISPSSYLADLESSAEEHGEEDRRCPICLGSYSPSDYTPSLRIVTNCGHNMHASCLETWLRTNSSCPLCKVHIVEDRKMSSA